MEYYIRIVALLENLDCWTTGPYHSYHKIAHKLGMTQDQFQFLWHYFHIRKPEIKDLKEDEQENEDGDSEEEFY